MQFEMLYNFITTIQLNRLSVATLLFTKLHAIIPPFPCPLSRNAM